MPLKKGVGDGGSAAQKCAHGALPDAVRATKKSSTPVASGTTAEEGAADRDKATTNRNLAQGKESDVVRTATSYFDPVWNSFSKHTDGSMQWIPKQIVAIGEDFHSVTMVKSFKESHGREYVQIFRFRLVRVSSS